jgi:hypothetical protein
VLNSDAANFKLNLQRDGSKPLLDQHTPDLVTTLALVILVPLSDFNLSPMIIEWENNHNSFRQDMRICCGSKSRVINLIQT